MRAYLILATLAVAVPSLAQAEPGGCLKYGAAGAVGGHLMHHHGVMGAMGGCAVGMMRRHEYRRAHAAGQAPDETRAAPEDARGGTDRYR